MLPIGLGQLLLRVAMTLYLVPRHGLLRLRFRILVSLSFLIRIWQRLRGSPIIRPTQVMAFIRHRLASLGTLILGLPRASRKTPRLRSTVVLMVWTDPLSSILKRMTTLGRIAALWRVTTGNTPIRPATHATFPTKSPLVRSLPLNGTPRASSPP